jgi:hypothetical protein
MYNAIDETIRFLHSVLLFVGCHWYVLVLTSFSFFQSHWYAPTTYCTSNSTCTKRSGVFPCVSTRTMSETSSILSRARKKHQHNTTLGAAVLSIYVIHHASPYSSETSSTLSSSPSSRHCFVIGIVAIGSVRIVYGVFGRDPSSR